MFELKQWRISKFGKQTSDINPKDLKTTKDYKDQQALAVSATVLLLFSMPAVSFRHLHIGMPSA